jgi:hypothetical protein
MKFKSGKAQKALKGGFTKFRIAIVLVAVMAATFCLWGLWDIAQWNTLYPGKPYPFPFLIFSMPWWIAGDVLVAVAAACVFVLAIIGSRKK